MQFIFLFPWQIVDKNGKCCQFCLYPQLPVEASHHRCANFGNKFHGICSDIRHPRADELQLNMGNDRLAHRVRGALVQMLSLPLVQRVLIVLG